MPSPSVSHLSVHVDTCICQVGPTTRTSYLTYIRPEIKLLRIRFFDVDKVFGREENIIKCPPCHYEWLVQHLHHLPTVNEDVGFAGDVT